MSHSQDNKCQTVSWAVGDAPLELGPCIAAIGNFDGVHRGHGKVIEAAIDAARKAGVAAAAVTFDPHPREFFRHDDVPFCLADRIEKDRLLAAAGVDRVIHVTFDDNLRCTDAAAFVTDILPAIGVTGLFAGSDFAFGRGRGGDIDTINAMGADIGIKATAVPLLSDENSAVISSSRIRAALQAGEVGRVVRARAAAQRFAQPERAVDHVDGAMRGLLELQARKLLLADLDADAFRQ